MRKMKDVVESIMAAFCRMCPLCICARRQPDGNYAQVMKKLEKACPFCRAYARRRGSILKG